MTQLEKDIDWLKEKYGNTHAIKCAETIMRVVAFAEKHKGLYRNGNDKKEGIDLRHPILLPDLRNNADCQNRAAISKTFEGMAGTLP